MTYGRVERMLSILVKIPTSKNEMKNKEKQNRFCCPCLIASSSLIVQFVTILIIIISITAFIRIAS